MRWRPLSVVLAWAIALAGCADILRERLFGATRIGDLSAREKAGDAPGLIVNTTLYNNGRRLAMTSLPSSAFEYDFFEDLERSVRAQGRVMEDAPYARDRWALLRPMTPLDISMDACAASLAGAATASASFRPLIGPITLRVGEEEVYWHAGDGGLYENSGIESLLLLYLKQLRDGRARRALIIAFDSSFPFAVGERKLLHRSLPFSLLTFRRCGIPWRGASVSRRSRHGWS